MSGMQSLVLGLTPIDAAHLVVALQQYRRRCEVDHLPYPPALQAMEGEVSAGVLGGQARPELAGQLHSQNAVPMSRSPLVTYDQAAELLACSVRTVKRRIASGDIDPVRNGRSVRIRRQDINRLVNEGGIAC